MFNPLPVSRVARPESAKVVVFASLFSGCHWLHQCIRHLISNPESTGRASGTLRLLLGVILILAAGSSSVVEGQMTPRSLPNQPAVRTANSLEVRPAVNQPPVPLPFAGQNPPEAGLMPPLPA